MVIDFVLFLNCFMNEIIKRLIQGVKPLPVRGVILHAASPVCHLIQFPFHLNLKDDTRLVLINIQLF